MGDDGKVAAFAAELERSTNLLAHEREALASTQAFADPRPVFELLAHVELAAASLHKRLVEWHTRHPERPSLEETDAFWADLKGLRAAKEQLTIALEAIKARERVHPTMRTQLERATHDVGDVERYVSSYLDRANTR